MTASAVASGPATLSSCHRPGRPGPCPLAARRPGREGYPGRFWLQFSLADLLRQSVYSRLAGYADHNDAVRVSADPTFRLMGSPKRWDRGAALTSTLHWFETELLTHEENLVGLRAVNRELRAQAEMATRADRIVLDMDSSESPVHGAQKGARITGTLHPSATTRCFCSTTRATAWPPRCGPATCRAPTTGTTSWSRVSARLVTGCGAAVSPV